MMCVYNDYSMGNTYWSSSASVMSSVVDKLMFYDSEITNVVEIILMFLVVVIWLLILLYLSFVNTTTVQQQDFGKVRRQDLCSIQ